MKEFKVGDRVYFPLKTTKICTIVEGISIYYPLKITLNTGIILEACTTLGELYRGDGTPSIFHATVENQTKLEALFNTKFEDAPKKRVIVCFEVPEHFEPELHEMYWYLDNCGEVDFYRFDNSRVDNSIKFKWRTKEEARQALNTFNEVFGIQ